MQNSLAVQNLVATCKYVPYCSILKEYHQYELGSFSVVEEIDYKSHISSNHFLVHRTCRRLAPSYLY